MTPALLTRSAPGQSLTGWFDAIAALLLGRVVLVAGTTRLRLLEVEVYHHSNDHPDPFVHGHPGQLSHSRWYLHREEAGYRGGSFKGLDITFGEGCHGGVLIRTLRGPGGVVNGSSLCVDALLAATGAADVAALDATLGDVWDTTRPLHLVPIDDPPVQTWKTARVGLTLRRAWTHRQMPAYIGRPYRYLCDARAVKKGRPYHVLALHRAGTAADDIHTITGSPARTIKSYIDHYEAGRAQKSLRGWFGKPLAVGDLCAMLGAWDARYGATRR